MEIYHVIKSFIIGVIFIVGLPLWLVLTFIFCLYKLGDNIIKAFREAVREEKQKNNI